MGNQENQPKKSNSAVIWIILNVVQTAIITTLIIMMMGKNDKIEDLNADVDKGELVIEQKTNELFELRDQYMRIQKEKKAMGLDLEELNSQIANLDNLIADLKSGKKIDEAKIKSLNAQIANFKKDIALKDAEIAQLKEENDSLYAEVDTLTVEKTQLTTELTESKTSNEELNAYIKAASVLKTDDIRVSALSDKNKEFVKDEYKAKSIDRIRIRFKLIDNKAATKDTKTFFVRLITPSGKVFSDANNGGGLTTLHDGKEVEYTMNQNLRFDNSGQELAFTMLKGFNYTAGNYIIEVICEGHKIGQGYFIVK